MLLLPVFAYGQMGIGGHGPTYGGDPSAPGTISVFELDHNTETLNAARTILITDKPIQYFDCNGTDRNVTLPAEASNSTDIVFTFVNTSDGAGEDLVVKNDAGTTIQTIGPVQAGSYSCNGTDWKALDNDGLYYDGVDKLIEADASQFTVGRDTDGYVGILLERRYIGKYDWLIKNAGHFEIYGADGNGTIPETLRFRINDDGSVDMFAGLSVTGPISASTYFNAGDGYLFEDGQTGDTWFWMGQTSDNEADDDDLWYMGKGNSIGTGSFMSIDGNGNLDSNGTASFAGIGIGTTAPTADLDITDLADNAELFLPTYEAGSSKYSKIRLRKSHSNTLADVQTVLNEYLGIIQFEGQNTTPAFSPGSRIYARQSNTSGATVPSNLYLESSDEYSLFPDQFVVSDDRSVGINTKDPAATLDVVGNLSTALTGTVSPTQTSTTLEGVGTAFTTELEVGDAIRIPSTASLMVAYEIFTVAGITDADTLTLDSAYAGGTTTGLIAYKDGDLFRLANGDNVEKFVVDKDGNLSVSGQLFGKFKTYEFSADAVTLTATHCLDTLITNKDWGGANDQIFTLPDADTSVGEGLKFKLLIVDASGGTADCYLDPEGSTTKIYLDGTALTDGHQVWTQQPAVGESITCHTFTIDGTTYDWACDSCNGIWENKGS